MLILKTVYNDDNYSVACISSYSVHRPVQERDAKDVPKDPGERQKLSPIVDYRTIDGSSSTRIVDGCNVYIENERGKTVDVIRPRFESALSA